MDIKYRVTRSRKRKKTISLQILNESEVLVSAPYFTPPNEVRRFVQEKQNWINKTIQKHKEDSLKNKAKEYKTGEHFFYLGQSYPLEVFSEPFDNERVVFRNNRFYLNTQKNKNSWKYYFVSWYKKKAHDFIHERVDFYSRMLKLRYGTLKITSAQSRWAACSEDNNLTFSYRLIMVPQAIIDYVIVHELSHIREKNHSPRFWKLVEAFIPEYKTHRRWLKENHHKFIL
ncbi:MAG: M48 family metallopeptidase [Syntrophaceae bacterium]|nr:M48 family metallopeptidase [Syntrophaceae bacterium]